MMCVIHTHCHPERAEPLSEAKGKRSISSSVALSLFMFIIGQSGPDDDFSQSKPVLSCLASRSICLPIAIDPKLALRVTKHCRSWSVNFIIVGQRRSYSHEQSD